MTGPRGRPSAAPALDGTPVALSPDAPDAEVWGHVFASITELGVYGY